jgi:hypothetical protein
MRKILETSTEHIDEIENTQSVDVYFVDDDGEEGTVACEVCLDTGKAFYKDNIYRSSRKVKEAIEEIRKTIVKKKPTVVVKVVGGNVTDVFSDTDLELDVLDFDTEMSSEEDQEDMKKIPDSYGKIQDAYLYCSGILEVNTDEAKAVFKALNS